MKLAVKFLIVIMILFQNISFAQEIERVEPPFWWEGMQNTNLQLLVYGENISELTPQIDNNLVSIIKVHEAKSPNYLFIDLDISKAEVGFFDVHFLKGKRVKEKFTYELKKREGDSKNREGFNSSDAILLITPDRFANANPENDQIPGLLEQEINRDHDYKRHGGDIQGITEHLDYIDDLGYTAIWSCPLLTNDMKSQSYHGYAITDL